VVNIANTSDIVVPPRLAFSPDRGSALVRDFGPPRPPGLSFAAGIKYGADQIAYGRRAHSIVLEERPEVFKDVLRRALTGALPRTGF
jgi:hypothetical protein